MKTYKQWRAENWSDRGSEAGARHWYKRYCQRYELELERERLEQQHTAAVNVMPEVAAVEAMRESE